jgi:hypothetical protein
MRLAAVCLLIFAASPALAQSVDQSKLYVTDPAACELLREKGVDAFGELDFLAMSFTDGIQGNEFNCNFYSVMAKDNSTDVLVQAICEEPGFKYPDLISVAPWDDTRVQVGSLYELQRALVSGTSGEATEPESSDGQAAGITLYSACEGLSELPRN